MKSLLIILILFNISFLSFSQTTDSAQYFLKKGIEEKNQRLYAVAAKDFDKAISINPNYTQAYIENGNADIEMRKVDAAQASFSKAYELEPNNGEVIKQLSSLYFNNRQFQKAIDLVQKCGSCEEEEKNRILGMSYYNLEDYANAETFLKKAIDKNDKDAEAAYTLARTYIELEKEKDAIPLFEKAIAIDQSRNTWMYELGLLYYNQEDYKNALNYFNMAADKGYIKSGDFNENVGFAQLYTGDIENGMKTINDLLEKKPNNHELINNVAYAMYETKHYDDALIYFQKLMTINNNDASSLYMIGMTLQKKGDTDRGQKICDKAIAMDPSLTKNRQKRETQMGL